MVEGDISMSHSKNKGIGGEMSRLTTKVNSEWDSSSLEGERISGIVCHSCGYIVPLTYQQLGFGMRYGLAIHTYCPNCFKGDKETALTCRIGGN